MSNEVDSLTVKQTFNPNHRYRFYALGAGDGCTRLFTVRFTNKDQSIYLSPCLKGKRQGSDFHISFHKTGIVNVKGSGIDERPQSRILQPSPLRRVATFQFNNFDSFERASFDEFNNPRGGHQHILVPGVLFSPAMLTIYCIKHGQDWKPPRLGNTQMLRYISEILGKNYNFEFVVWGNTKMPFGEGDWAIEFGGKVNDRLYGV